MELLVLGANSDIGFAIASTFAKLEKADLILASRDIASLEKKAKDIEIRYGVKTKVIQFDATHFDTHQYFYNELSPKPDGVVVAFGYLGDEKDAEQSFENAKKNLDTNFTGAMSILEIIARDFEARNNGVFIGLSSVAGERGRQSNYIYGAAKGAFTIYLSGLRNRLHKSNVRVITVLPGFVQTKMTAALDLPEKLVATPEEVASDIYSAFKKRKDIVYSKWFWRWIMLIIKAIPEMFFKKMNL